MKLTRRGKWFTAVFLTLTAGALVTEVLFAFDGNTDTHPWTDLIINYVPWQFAVAIFGALLLWVPVHFFAGYTKRERKIRESEREKVGDEILRQLKKRNLTLVCPHGYGIGSTCGICGPITGKVK